MACSTYYGTVTNFQTLYGTTSVAATLYGTSLYTTFQYITTTSVSGGYTERRIRRRAVDHDGKLPTSTAYIAPTSTPRRDDLLGLDIGDQIFIAPASSMPTAAPIVDRGLDVRAIDKRDIVWCTNPASPYAFIGCSKCEAQASYFCTQAAYPYIGSCIFNTVTSGCFANIAAAGWASTGMSGVYAYGSAATLTITSSVISTSIFPTLTTFSSSTFPTATSTIVTSSATSTSCPAGVASPTNNPTTAQTTAPTTAPTPVSTAPAITSPGTTTSTPVNGAGVSVVASSPTTSPIPAPTSSGHNGLSTGAKAGIGIGAALGALAVLGIIIFFIAKDRKNNTNDYPNTTDPNANGSSNGYAGQNGHSSFSGPSPGGADTGVAGASYTGVPNGGYGAGGGFSVDPAMAGVGTAATLGAAGTYGAHQYQQQQPFADSPNVHFREIGAGGDFGPSAAGAAAGSSLDHRQSVMSGSSREPTTRSGAISPTIATTNSGNFRSTHDSVQVRDGGHDRLWDD